MAFHDVRFPEDIAYGSTGGPVFNTDIVATRGGKEQRTSYWEHGRSRYNVSHGLQSTAHIQTLLAFFRARQGRAHSFRYKDWVDYQAISQPIATADGSTNQFQLLKHYSSGSVEIERIITKPVSGTVVIYEDAVEQENVTVDYLTGIVTFDTPPAAEIEITADFEFDVMVRFDSDQLAISLDSRNLRSWDAIELVELV